MSSNKLFSQPPQKSPAELPELPVFRETYCSQQTTNKIIRFLQERRPDLIKDIAFELRTIAWDLSMFNRRITTTLHDLEEAEAGGDIELPRTNLGTVDLIFELSRRITRACWQCELQFYGKPIGPGPEGPFVPLAEPADLPEEAGVTLELADRVTRLIYEQSPRLFYEMAEQKIRYLRLYIIEKDLDAVLTKLGPEVVPPTNDARFRILREVNTRIHKMSGSPESNPWSCN